jgi:hypothetical protein
MLLIIVQNRLVSKPKIFGWGGKNTNEKTQVFFAESKGSVNYT